MVSSGILRNLALLGVLGILAACTGYKEVESGPPCPNIVIVKDTATLTAFKPGPGSDLTDVVLEAEIERYSGFCETDLERDKSGEVEVDLRLFFQLLRGPASTSRQAGFNYFVAIADRKGNILAKETFDTVVEFEGNRTRLGAVEELTQKIPLASGQTGGDFDIFIGFQLSGAQLEYNNQRRQR